MKHVEVIGKKFGRLTAIRRLPNCKVTTYLFACECGHYAKVRLAFAQMGKTSSCGCLARELAAKRTGQLNLTHGQARHDSRSPAYRSWRSVITRCENPKSLSYPRYGGRGIKICRRWRESFVAFLADMGPRPSGTTIDRIDNNGNYEPDNCRWATSAEQAANKSTTIWIIVNGKRRPLAEVARESGLNGITIAYRMKVKGLSAEVAISLPGRTNKKHN